MLTGGANDAAQVSNIGIDTCWIRFGGVCNQTSPVVSVHLRNDLGIPKRADHSLVHLSIGYLNIRFIAIMYSVACTP
jgi:hypothetical protein